MEVVRYLHHSDLLLEDEEGVVIIGGSRYVLSVGDKVVLKKIRWCFKKYAEKNNMAFDKIEV
ncbi:hypothetical protein EVX74_007085 [Acinetobacter lwoffii]|uniref:Uncharacterized protein n=1 Tax=Acinetobacter lwoffii TaxID=28090 RepID=A0AAJ4P836_ACILW|nr:hypothetical protein EVX74_007085 [Acinetobacter lwoffii]